MSTHRKILPPRRYAETFTLAWGKQNTPIAVTVGYWNVPAFDEHGWFRIDQIGEIFISGAKSGSDLDAADRDNAILLSLCLQHHVPLQTIQHALTREENGAPSTLIGLVVDRLMGKR